MKTESNEWPSQDVLRKLIEAAEILLHRMDYDGDEYEDISHCVERAKQHLQPQPAEDPDEWVIQNRVPIRVTIDRCWYMDGECGLPANPEDMWQKYNKDGFLDGKGHGDYVRDGGGTLHVMCRRRDLPKVEPKNCNGCGKPLLPENAWMEDGCSCNSPRGVN